MRSKRFIPMPELKRLFFQPTRASPFRPWHPRIGFPPDGGCVCRGWSFYLQVRQTESCVHGHTLMLYCTTFIFFNTTHTITRGHVHMQLWHRKWWRDFPIHDTGIVHSLTQNPGFCAGWTFSPTHFWNFGQLLAGEGVVGGGGPSCDGIQYIQNRA